MSFVLRYKLFILLGFIVLAAGFLRFYRINSIPVSLYWDETASTYNAYSISQTGRDEYGNVMPMLFRSFEDYKMPGNIYITSVIVKLFGLNEVTARASSAFLGTLTVFITYFLIKEILYAARLSDSKKKKIIYNDTAIETIGLLSSFLMAISPWHLQFSRSGFEANSGLFFVVSGIWLCLRSIHLNSKKLFFVAMAIFSISFYFYRSIHIFLPLFLVGMFFLFREEFFTKQWKRTTILGILLFLLLVLPLLPHLLSKEGLARARQVNIFFNVTENLGILAQKQEKEGSTIVNRIIYNRRFVYVRLLTTNYISHFGPYFLFIEGDTNLRHGPIHIGQLYLWEIPFFLIGLLVLWKLQRKVKYLLLWWFLIAPIPAALSVPSPHALRDLNVLPIPQLISSVGITSVYLLLQKNLRPVFLLFLCIAIAFFFNQYLYSYYVTTAKLASRDWADGYKQLTQYVFAHEKSYDKVVISGHYWQPYIYFLFYKKYDPRLYQKYGSKKKFDRYVFGGTSWDKEQWSQEFDNVDLKKISEGKRTLIGLSQEEYYFQKNNIQKIGEIMDHNNELIFIIGTVL